LIYNPYPTLGGPNYDNGDAPPRIEFKGIDLELLKQGQWRFRANAWAPAGMFTLVVNWREVTSSANPRSGMILLYDDGMHDDGGSLDGVFAGDWDNPLPAGTPIEFFMQGMNLRFSTRSDPSGSFTEPNQPIENYTFGIPAVSTDWEISEVVPRNSRHADESGKKPDWAEIRFTGTAAAAVDQIFLSDTLYRPNADQLYDVARGGNIAAPGQSRVIFLSGTPASPEKPMHANFKVDGGGDSIYLLRRLPSGAYEYIDHAKVPELEKDVAYARLGKGGPFVVTVPTPNQANAARGGQVHLVPGAAGGLDCIFAFTGAGSTEVSNNLVNWSALLPWQPAGTLERVHREPFQGGARFFRVR
jgi:hypothetical protein